MSKFLRLRTITTILYVAIALAALVGLGQAAWDHVRVPFEPFPDMDTEIRRSERLDEQLKSIFERQDIGGYLGPHHQRVHDRWWLDEEPEGPADPWPISG